VSEPCDKKEEKEKEEGRALVRWERVYFPIVISKNSQIPRVSVFKRILLSSTSALSAFSSGWAYVNVLVYISTPPADGSLPDPLPLFLFPSLPPVFLLFHTISLQRQRHTGASP